MAEEEEEVEEVEEKPKQSGSPAKYMLIILVILALEGVGGYVVLDRAMPAPEQAAEEEIAELTGPPEPKSYLFYEGFHQIVVNPVEGRGRALVQVSLALQLDGLAAEEEVGLKHDVLWDLILRRLETYSVLQLRDPYKREIKETLKREINAELRNGEVTELLFTDIIVQ